MKEEIKKLMLEYPIGTIVDFADEGEEIDRWIIIEHNLDNSPGELDLGLTYENDPSETPDFYAFPKDVTIIKKP